MAKSTACYFSAVQRELREAQQRQERKGLERQVQLLQKFVREANRATALTAQFLAFARRQVLQPRKINLNTLVEQGMSLLGSVIGDQIEIRVLPAAGLRVTRAVRVKSSKCL